MAPILKHIDMIKSYYPYFLTYCNSRYSSRPMYCAWLSQPILRHNILPCARTRPLLATKPTLYAPIITQMLKYQYESKKNTQKYCGIRKYTYLCPKSLAKRHGVTMQLPEPQALMQGGEGDLLVHVYKR